MHIELSGTLNIHIHSHGTEVQPWAAEVMRKLDLILHKQEIIMVNIDDVLAEVTDEGSRLDSIQTLIDGIKQQLADALSGATVPPAVQTKIDAVFAGLTANKGKIDKALNSNVPPAPVDSNAPTNTQPAGGSQ